jgi:hypothetical protein
MGYNPNDPIWVPNPDGEGRLAATFVAPGDQAEAEIDPTLGVRRDVAWITYEDGEREGTTAKYFYRELAPRELP